MRTIQRLLCLLVVMWSVALKAEPPTNDPFDSPLLLTGFPASVISSNVDATLENDEPEPSDYEGSVQASVWFRWTAPTTTTVQVDTLGSDFDTVLAVWTGSTLPTLTLLEVNDQYSGDQSAVFFTAISGVTYQIAVYGWYENRGSILLNITDDMSSRLTGQVTGPGGTPLEGIEVSVLSWFGFYWSERGRSSTDADGSYEIRGLLPDTYRVLFLDPFGTYLHEYYQNASSLDAATDIEVPAAAHISDIDAELAAASKITGRVTGPDDHTPLEGIEVTAYSWAGFWLWRSSASTDTSGFYSVGNLATGAYRVVFIDFGGNYFRQTYSNAPNLDAGQDIFVAATSTVSDINASLGVASKITGTVTGPDEVTPLPDVLVSTYVRSGFFWVSSGLESALTDENGNYTLGGLTAGTYRVRFIHLFDAYVSEYYNDAQDVYSATDVVVPATTTVSDINASLSSGASISGTITDPDGFPLAGIHVSALRFSGFFWQTAGGAFSDINGDYTINGLSAGTYRVEFSSFEYVTKYYDDALDFNAATGIILAEDEAVSGIDASLAVASRISGTVTGPDGETPLSGIGVFVYAWDGFSWVSRGFVYTGMDGAYIVGGLPAGTYRVQFGGWAADLYLSQIYSNALTFNDGMDVVLPAGEEVAGINAVLQLASRIEGRITRLDGVTVPSGTIIIGAYRWNGVDYDYLNNTSMDVDGTYRLGGLPAGTYRLYFYTPFGFGYQNRYYTNALTINEGTDVILPEGETVTNINVSLTAFSNIRGAVTRSDGITPLEGVEARAFQWTGTGWSWINTGYSDASGHYAIPQLYAGTYRVQFVDASDLYVTKVYDDMSSLDSGLDVIAPEDGDAEDVNARLALDVDLGSVQPIVIGLSHKPNAVWDVRFTTMSGLIYRVRSADGLTNGWIDGAGPVISQGGTNTLSVTGNAAQAYFNILAEP